MREIKRYANRKLYDTKESRYITLDEIAALIQEGVEVQVIDNRTGDDISRQTLVQIILRQEKRQKSPPMPIGILRELVQRGGSSLTGALHRGVKPLRDLYSHVGGEVDRFLAGLIERGVVTEEEGKKMLRGLLEKADRGRASLESKVDARVAGALEKLNVPTTDEVEMLHRKIDDLVRKIDELTSK